MKEKTPFAQHVCVCFQMHNTRLQESVITPWKFRKGFKLLLKVYNS